MHGFFLPQASIELCRSQNLGMEPARRHEDGLSSPYQNALCSAFTRKKAFGHPFPQGRGENDLFWHQFSGQSRLKEGLVCPGRCQPSALKKSRFFVLPREPL